MTTLPEKKKDADYFLKVHPFIKKTFFTSLIPMLTYKQLHVVTKGDE